MQTRDFSPSGQKPKEFTNEYKLNPTGSQESKRKQNSVTLSKGHARDIFLGERGC